MSDYFMEVNMKKLVSGLKHLGILRACSVVENSLSFLEK